MKVGSIVRLNFLNATGDRSCFKCVGIVLSADNWRESITVHFADTNDTIEYFLGQFDNEIECEVLSE